MRYTIYYFIATILMLTGNLVNGQWTVLNPGTSNFLVSTSFISSDSGYVADENGNIFKTINGGTNWNMTASLSTSTMSIDFSDTADGILVGDSVFKTSDGGYTWQRTAIDTALIWYWKCQYISKDTIVISGFDMNYFTGYILMSTDGGSNWSHKGIFPNNAITTCFFINSKYGFAVCDSGIVKTTNGGSNWSVINDLNLTYSNSLFFINKDTGFAVGNAIYKTINGGLNWTLITQPFSGAFYSVFFTNSNLGYIVGGNGINSGTIIKSIDKGLTWTQATTSAQTFNCIDFPDPSTGYAVGTNGTILKYSGIVDINENSILINNNLFPNPANDKITIESQQEFSIESLISIYNVQGQLVLQLPLIQNIQTIDISGLSEGLYILKLSNSNNTIMTKILKE